MPNRIIRESCRTSETLDRLSGDGERLFWRLVTVADDFGRFEADPRVIRAACFPLRDTMKTQSVERWFTELVSAGLVVPYTADDKRYAFFATWEKHQDRRAKNSKFPDPPADARTCEQMRADSPEEPRIEEPRIEDRDTRNGRVHGAPLSHGEWFDRILQPAYPEHRRHTQETSARNFVTRTLRPDEGKRSSIITHLEAWIVSEDWTRDGGQYVPGMRRFFENRCHERLPIPRSANGKPEGHPARSTIADWDAEAARAHASQRNE